MLHSVMPSPVSQSPPYSVHLASLRYTKLGRFLFVMFRPGPGSGACFRIHDVPTSTGFQTKVLKLAHRRRHGMKRLKRHTSYTLKPDPDRLCALLSTIELGADNSSAHPSLPLPFNPLDDQAARFLENLTSMAKRSREDIEVGVGTPDTYTKVLIVCLELRWVFCQS